MVRVNDLSKEAMLQSIKEGNLRFLTVRFQSPHLIFPMPFYIFYGQISYIIYYIINNSLNNFKNYHCPIWNSSLTSHCWYCYSIMSSCYKCNDSIQNFDDNDDKPDDNMWTKAIQLDNGCLTWTVSCCHWQYPTDKIKIPTESFFSHIYHPPYLFKKKRKFHAMSWFCSFSLLLQPLSSFFFKIIKDLYTCFFQDDSNRSLLSEKKFSKECIRCCVLQNKAMSTIEVRIE